MSQYTTGEIAKLCDISVRTVQFYDTRDLLHPSELTEGGRRLYSEGDLKKMKLICILKSFGLSLDSIKGILQSERPEKVLTILLDEKSKQLDSELSEMQKRRDEIDEVRSCLHSGEISSVNSIGDIENIMNGKKTMRKTRGIMLGLGILMETAEIASLLVWIYTGMWQVFAGVMAIVIAACVLLVKMYYKNTSYICPECGKHFKPTMREFFFARHTFKTRKLTCTACGTKAWCVETYADEA